MIGQAYHFFRNAIPRAYSPGCHYSSCSDLEALLPSRHRGSLVGNAREIDVASWGFLRSKGLSRFHWEIIRDIPRKKIVKIEGEGEKLALLWSSSLCSFSVAYPMPENPLCARVLHHIVSDWSLLPKEEILPLEVVHSAIDDYIERSSCDKISPSYSYFANDLQRELREGEIFLRVSRNAFEKIERVNAPQPISGAKYLEGQLGFRDKRGIFIDLITISSTLFKKRLPEQFDALERRDWAVVQVAPLISSLDSFRKVEKFITERYPLKWVESERTVRVISSEETTKTDYVAEEILRKNNVEFTSDLTFTLRKGGRIVPEGFRFQVESLKKGVAISIDYSAS